MRRVLCLVVSFTLFGCSDGGGGSGEVVEGVATSVGPIADANVEVHAVGDNVAPQRLLRTTTTAANGDFSLSSD